MKKFTVLALALLMPLFLCAQAQIDTKKMKISDFTQKITKVVLTGNQFHDATLQAEVTAKWQISPFEFCSLKEFEQLRSDDNYYFLLTTKGQFKNEVEPGIVFLSLVKGGADADKGINKMLEIVSFPYSAAEDPSGREVVFLPFILDIIQSYTLESMEHDLNGYGGLGSTALLFSKSDDTVIVFSERDISQSVTQDIRDLYFDERTLVVDEDVADGYMVPEKMNTLVSYVVAPSTPGAGSYCYKMLIDPNTSELCYFKKHRMFKGLGAGFLMEDLRRIFHIRKKK